MMTQVTNHTLENSTIVKRTMREDPKAEREKFHQVELTRKVASCRKNSNMVTFPHNKRRRKYSLE